MKCSRCQQENPSHAKFCLECGTPVGRGAPSARPSADLQAEIEGLRHALNEALEREAEAREQEAATAEILRLITSSPGDAQPVFDAIAVNALRLCDAQGAVVVRYDGTLMHLAAHHNVNSEAVERLKRQFPSAHDHHHPSGRAILNGAVVHVPDLQAAGEFSESVARQFGARSHVSIPLLHQGRAIGAIGISRWTPGPFSDKQIALLQTFADQAVIAIENVRLFTELQQKNVALTQAHAQVTESLEQQTATSEILRVIASSPTDIQPVLDALAESATRLARSVDCNIFLLDADRLVLRARHGYTGAEEVGEFVLPLVRGFVGGRTVLERQTIHVVDLLAETDYSPQAVENARRFGFRTMLSVPLLRQGAAVGVIQVRRTEVNPFAERQVELLKTFADQAVIAIENVRLFKELEARNRDLTESLDRQTATADVLRIIAQSPSDLQPVLDAIAASARRLCAASDAVIERLEGDRFYNAAHAGTQMQGLVGLPLPLTRRFPGGRAVLDRRPIIIDDIHLVAASEYPDTLPLLELNTIHSVAEIPLLSEGKALGSIAVLRRDVRPFTDAEIALLETFADQAVIAIENVRLFTELQEKNQALTQAHAQVSESLEQQTATAEILSVISGSPTDIRPVFDAVLDRALTLCDASHGSLYQLEEGALRHVAARGISIGIELGGVIPLASLPGRAILQKRTVPMEDAQQDLDWQAPEVQAAVRRTTIRTAVAIPLLREQTAIGAIVIRRLEVRPFSEKQIRLLQTFADQAVIAIENVRLFTELQEKNQALTTAHAQVTESLEQQTATSEILRVISQSQTDVQPVFDAIVSSATRLCRTYDSVLFLLDGQSLRLVAHDGPIPSITLLPVVRGAVGGRSVLERQPVHVADLQAEVETFPEANARQFGFRTILCVPLLREGQAIGILQLRRTAVAPFADQQVALLQTFADQAVIAIENVRLFKELEARTQELTRSVDELTVLGEVSRALSSTLNLETVLQTIVLRANDLAKTAGCTIWEYDEARQEFRLRASDYPDEADAATLQGVDRVTMMRKGVGVTTQVMERREPVAVHDIAVEGAAEENPIRRRLIEAGHHALLGVPLLSEDEVIGVLAVTRKTAGEFEPETVRLLSTFATQSALAIQNARLFLEIEDKSRQLEVASRHKSEFLANMSHELRTPMNAILGFSEVLAEGMFGEINEKQAEYLRDILESGRHLLSLINDILDLSKIEAGRMELEPTDFDLPGAIDNALTLVRERAGRRGITLGREIDQRVGTIRADERKVKQVVLNLLSNAIKFTSEGGRIDVSAAVNEGLVEVSVTDTGVGIAPEDQETVFEEFRQVGTADKKVEGTGLGLALSRKFIELHGGRIWVKSQIGEGSTFTFTLPVRRGQ